MNVATKQRQRSKVFAILGLVGLLILAACGGSDSTSKSSADKISMAAPPIDTCSELFTADAMGYFKKHGLDVDLKMLASGPAISAGVLGGSLDGGCSSVGSLGGAVAKGLPLRVIAPGAVYSSEAPTSQLVVAAGSDIKTASDLAGKTIAVSGLTTIAETATREWLDDNGGRSTAAKFIEMTHPQMAAALKAGRVDAALLVEPSLTTAETAGTVKVIANPFDSVGKNFMLTVIFSSSELVKERPQVVTKLQLALKEARSFSVAHPDRTAQILAKYTDLPTSTAESMTRASWPITFDIASLQPPLDNALRYKVLSKPLKAEAMVADGAQ